MLEKFLIGHVSDQEKGTGVSVILAPEGAVGGVSVRGSAPGTRETDLLKADALVDKINAVVLAGGSAFGLEASCGVMQYLHEKNLGYNTGTQTVPIVCSAVIYDLDYKGFAYPDMKMGYAAAKAAKANNVLMGNVGAGTGATVGKIMGLRAADKGGLGVARAKLGTIEIMAIVAVNAFGDIYEDNQIIAGVKTDEGQFLNTCNLLLSDIEIDKKMKNTTIGCILTNAILTKAQANKLADQAHNAFAMTIRPVHTMLDGDTIFVMASGEEEAEFVQLAEAAVSVMAKAVTNAVKR